ncbi:hypothetical protein EYC08_01220 [Tabrizicola sp. WMC-M-20]|nr:hypothetical protein EYC08_01220 [Tabrizicola sp. WMC-M-20]
MGGLMSAKFFKVQDNVTQSRHAYSPVGVTMSKPKIDTPTPGQQ